MKKSILLRIVIMLASVGCWSQASAQDPNFHIYLCFGQSNMAGAGDIETQDETVDSRFQFMKPQDCASENEFAGKWYDAVPPLWGCSGGIGPSDYFGRTMAANRPAAVKIGVVVVGIPGCKIELFGKTGFAGQDTYNNVPAKYNGSAYAWLLDLAKQAQKVGVIKGILLHQGESNTGDQAWPTKVKAVYDNLITDLGLDATQTPLLAGEMLYQNQGGVCYGHNSVIATLPNVLPNSHVISSSGLPGKDVYHFNSAGNRALGVRYAEKMLAIQPLTPIPSVKITAPVATNSLVAPATITISADASISTGSITKVEFFNGTTKVGEDVSSPYTYSWANVAAGTYILTAVASDNSDKSSTSAPVTIKVNPAQVAYSGIPSQIPGTIQFENFDLGGNGNAYLDNAADNTGGATYRTDEDVDIENCTDADAGYNIGFATAGEWLEYTVNVATSGKYDLTLRVACSNDGRTISLQTDGNDIATDIAIPNTKGWQTWENVTVQNISLSAGTQVIRVTIGASDYVNLNYMTFTKQQSNIQLKAGWNLVGCTIDGSTDLAEALSSISEFIETVKDADGFWDTSIPASFQSLTEMKWGNGYFVKVSADCELDWNK